MCTAVHVGILMCVIVTDSVDDLLRALGRGTVVQPYQRLSVDQFRKDRKIITDLRQGLAADADRIISRGSLLTGYICRCHPVTTKGCGCIDPAVILLSLRFGLYLGCVGSTSGRRITKGILPVKCSCLRQCGSVLRRRGICPRLRNAPVGLTLCSPCRCRCYRHIRNC